MMILDLGCGKSKKAGAYGVDLHPFAGVDLVHDLNKFPYPVDDNSYDLVIASHIVEHLENVPGFMNQVSRILKPGGAIEITTPHFSNRSAFADPTHKWAFSVRFLDFFCGSEPRPLGLYNKASHFLFEHRFQFEPFTNPPQFEIQRVNLTFSRIFRYLQIPFFANLWVDFYEFYFAFVFPARDIVARLKSKKEVKK